MDTIISETAGFAVGVLSAIPVEHAVYAGICGLLGVLHADQARDEKKERRVRACVRTTSIAVLYFGLAMVVAWPAH